MATVDLSLAVPAALTDSSATPNTSDTKKIYYIDANLDFAAAVTAKGSALAASDIIKVFKIPRKSVVLAAGLEYVTAVAGGVSVLTVSLGVSSVSATSFLSGFDLFGASVGAYPASNSAAYPVNVGTTDNTMDLTITTLTGALATGLVRVWAYCADTTRIEKPGIAQPGS